MTAATQCDVRQNCSRHRRAAQAIKAGKKNNLPTSARKNIVFYKNVHTVMASIGSHLGAVTRDEHLNLGRCSRAGAGEAGVTRLRLHTDIGKRRLAELKRSA
jgi:hypothetical protein